MAKVWARFKSLTNLTFLTGAVNTFVTVFLLCALQPQAMGQPRLTQRDLENPERVVQIAREPASERERTSSEWLYQNALKRMKQSYWDAAAKGFVESAVFYPTAKAFIGFAEARSYIARRHDQATKFLMLEGIRNFLASAVAVDEIQKQLTPVEMEQLKRDRACIGVFLATKKPQVDCRLVEIAFGKDG